LFFANLRYIFYSRQLACDANSSYALNMQVYTGKPVGRAPERNQGMRVVLDMAQGLRGHNITCDNFFPSYNLGQEQPW